MSRAVGDYWIVDAAARQVESLVNEHGRLVVAPPENDLCVSPSIDGLQLDPVQLWLEIAARLP